MSELVIHACGICTRACSHQKIDPAQVVICRAWLRRWAYRRKSINTRIGSYALKHMVEHSTMRPGMTHEQIDPWGRRWSGPYIYVSNGAFILAALLEGYRAIPCSSGSPNAYFDLGIRKVPLPVVELDAA